MYSYEDRLRAVRLYIKLGKRVALTIRQLGYPTKNALKSWHREYEQRLDLRAGYVRVPKYSQAQKERSVEHYLEHGRCLSATIEALGYPSRALLPVWIQELHPETRTRVVGRSQEMTPSMKEAAVIALCMRQGSAKSVAQELGVSRPSLYNWKNQLLSHDASSPMKRQQDSPASPERVELEQQIEALRRNIRRLQLEQDMLKKANELLKKDLGIDRQLLTNREKTQLVDALRPTYTLTELLHEVDLPRSSYFVSGHLTPSSHRAPEQGSYVSIYNDVDTYVRDRHRVGEPIGDGAKAGRALYLRPEGEGRDCSGLPATGRVGGADRDAVRHQRELATVMDWKAPRSCSCAAGGVGGASEPEPGIRAAADRGCKGAACASAGRDVEAARSSAQWRGVRPQ